MPGFEDAQARYIEGVIGDGAGGVYRVASIYLPNGNPPDSEKYGYKLAFMDALTERARALLALEERVVLAGDYNVIPAPEEVYDPVSWAGDALFKPETRAKFRQLLNLGYTEALRAVTTSPAFTHFGIIRPAPGKKSRASHRPSFAVAAGGRPFEERRNRQGAARPRKAIRPRSNSRGFHLSGNSRGGGARKIKRSSAD